MATTILPPAKVAGPRSQPDRRRRILETAITIASQGGFDAVQMRTVAQQSEVALGTLYRYFPSKIHLLVTALDRQFAEAQAALERRPMVGATSAERVEALLRWLTGALQRSPHLTEALARAFMFADASVAHETDAAAARLLAMITSEMDPDQDPAIARVVADVWLASLVAWVTGRSTAQGVEEHVGKAVRLVLR